MRRPRKEASIEQSCHDIARAHGCLPRKMNGMGFNSWPDRLFLLPGRAQPWFVEFKRVGKSSTPAQANLQRQLRNSYAQDVTSDLSSVEVFRAELLKRLNERRR